jgi:hypothetical protein
MTLEQASPIFQEYLFVVFLEVFDFPPSARFLRLMIGGLRDTCVRLTS